MIPVRVVLMQRFLHLNQYVCRPTPYRQVSKATEGERGARRRTLKRSSGASGGRVRCLQEYRPIVQVRLFLVSSSFSSNVREFTCYITCNRVAINEINFVIIIICRLIEQSREKMISELDEELEAFQLNVSLLQNRVCAFRELTPLSQRTANNFISVSSYSLSTSQE